MLLFFPFISDHLQLFFYAIEFHFFKLYSFCKAVVLDHDVIKAFYVKLNIFICELLLLGGGSLMDNFWS